MLRSIGKQSGESVESVHDQYNTRPVKEESELQSVYENITTTAENSRSGKILVGGATSSKGFQVAGFDFRLMPFPCLSGVLGGRTADKCIMLHSDGYDRYACAV